MSDDNFTKRFTHDSIKQEFEQTFDQRVERYLEVKPHGVIPNTHFARASSECSKLYRDAHFLGCISLLQSVTESLVRFVCSVNGFTPASNFERNVRTIVTNGIISTEQQEQILKLWENRDDFHHLNPSVESEYLELMRLSKEKILILNEIEKFFFDFDINKGVLVPKKPQYWTTGTQVFLRLD